MEALPQHVAIIMDGNRRAGKALFSDPLKGHRVGAETVEAIVRACAKRNIPFLTLYAFSTENWKRTKIEVDTLFELLSVFFDYHLERLLKENVRVRVIGRRDRLPINLVKKIESIEVMSAKKNGITVTIAIDYGGRDELVRAVTKIIRTDTEVSEESLSLLLDTSGVPDPDLMIRTGGEKRLSGFLLWQTAYAELYFIDTLWPQFTETDLDEALAWFAGRERRRGK